jgi:hypothetical protein
MHRKRVGWHRALRAQVAVKRVAGWTTVDKLNRSNLNDTMAFRRVKAGCLGIDNNLTHARVSQKVHEKASVVI